MPGRGRPTSPWWAHFQAVHGCIQISRFLVMNLECAADFRVVRCLHCDQLLGMNFEWWGPFRFKDSFFLDQFHGERATEKLKQLVEDQMEAMGKNNNEVVQNAEHLNI